MNAAARSGRLRAREYKKIVEQHVLPADCRVRRRLGQKSLQQTGDRSRDGPGDDVAGRALDHRHVRRLVGKRRHERNRGRAAADHGDCLAGIVEVLGPGLRVDDLPVKVLLARPFGAIAGLVIVIAAAGEQEPSR